MPEVGIVSKQSNGIYEVAHINKASHLTVGNNAGVSYHALPDSVKNAVYPNRGEELGKYVAENHGNLGTLVSAEKLQVDGPWTNNVTKTVGSDATEIARSYIRKKN